MESPLDDFLISSRLDKKHGCHGQFLFLILDILTNQKQELPMAAMFVNRSGHNEQSLSRTFHRFFLPSFGSFGQAASEKIF
jgi:hypothetical protein